MTMAVDHNALAEFEKNMADPMWRLSNLYKILIKGDDDETDLVIPFKPNRAQIRFIQRLWHRNVILKARQLGFTTLICIAWLDHALFNANVRCGIIAQDKDAAKVIFRDKVKLAYERLPDELRKRMPLARDSAYCCGHTQQCRLSRRGLRWPSDRSPPRAPLEALSRPTTLPAKGLLSLAHAGWPFTGLEAQSMVFLSRPV